MPDFITKIYQQIREFWEKLNSQQKIIIISASVIFIISTIVIFILAGRPTYSPLFTNLTPEDAGQIINKLKDYKIDYKVTAGGSAILVPKEVVYDTRLQLASEGLPQTGGVGFEIFDRTSYNITDFTQRLNYQRALQGELSRTISQLDAVEAARVHIVIPEERLYIEKEKEPTASVVLKLKPHTSLKEEQVKAIVNLVSHSVEGLKPDNVEVLDTHGNILTELLEKETSIGKLTLTQMEAKKSYERDLEKRLTSMLEKVLGPAKAISRVSAELDFSKKDTQSEIYQPVVDKEGIVRSQETEREKFKGTAMSPGGIPGVSSNVPGYPVTSPGQGEYEREREIKNLEISKITTREIAAPGVIKRLSVAVIVDSKNLTAKRIQDIKDVASAACGIFEQRGDKVSVVAMPFSTEIADRERKAQEAEVRRKITYLGIATLLALLFLITLYFTFRPKKEVIEEFGPLETIQIEKPEIRLEEEVEKIPAKTPEEIKAEEEITLSEEQKKKRRLEQIKLEIERLIKEKPENIVMALRSWIREE